MAGACFRFLLCGFTLGQARAGYNEYYLGRDLEGRYPQVMPLQTTSTAILFTGGVNITGSNATEQSGSTFVVVPTRDGANITSSNATEQSGSTSVIVPARDGANITRSNATEQSGYACVIAPPRCG